MIGSRPEDYFVGVVILVVLAIIISLFGKILQIFNKEKRDD